MGDKPEELSIRKIFIKIPERDKDHWGHAGRHLITFSSASVSSEVENKGVNTENSYTRVKEQRKGSEIVFEKDRGKL